MRSFETGNILKRLKWFLLANLLLLGLVSTSFIYAIRIIQKQKKIHEIRRDFVSNLTHEFKTPVATVSLALDGLIDYPIGEDPEKRNKYLDMARKENKRLGIMIERTLNMAAYEMGTLKINKKSIDINNLINEVVDNYEIHITGKGGKIITELSAKESVIEGDPDHLSQVFYNLIDNANKYTPDKAEIRVQSINPDNEYIEIQIIDNGIGIPKSKIKEIFKAFNRVEYEADNEIKGFGLGLAYVNRIIELHGGSISVTSEVSQGSCFSVKLPR